MNDGLTLEDFEPLIGQPFRMAYPGHAEALTLTAARVAPTVPPSGMRQGFLLTFAGESRDVLLGQHSYRLENDALGMLEIVLVPIDRLPDGNFAYEAVFG